MLEEELEPNAFVYSAAIAACARGGMWEKGIGMYRGLRASGFEMAEARSPTHTTTAATTAAVTMRTKPQAIYNAAISATAEGGQVEMALEVMAEMDDDGCKPGLRAFNGALKARHHD